MPKKPKPTKPDARRRKTLPRISEQTQEPVAKEGTVSGPLTDDPLEDEEAADEDEPFDPYETP